jgi:hypothetical protein
MKNKKPNAALMWKQFEDLAPRLRLSIAERTVYSYLLRHSRLEGRRRIEFSLREPTRSQERTRKKKRRSAPLGMTI